MSFGGAVGEPTRPAPASVPNEALLGEGLEDRVYGPELMLRYSERCAERGRRVWLYGGRDQGSLDQLALDPFANGPGHLPPTLKLLGDRLGVSHEMDSPDPVA